MTTKIGFAVRDDELQQSRQEHRTKVCFSSNGAPSNGLHGVPHYTRNNGPTHRDVRTTRRSPIKRMHLLRPLVDIDTHGGHRKNDASKSLISAVRGIQGRGDEFSQQEGRQDQGSRSNLPRRGKRERGKLICVAGRVEASHQVNTPPPTSAARQFDRKAAALSIVVDARARASPSKLKSSVEQCFRDNIIRRE